MRMVSRLGKIPEEGDTVKLDDITVKVEKMNGHRVGKVLIKW